MSAVPLGVHGLMAFRPASDRPGVAVRIVAGLGSGCYTREDCAWSTVQPSGPTDWQWTSTDAWITDCATAGLRVFAILTKPPVWAVGGSSIGVSWTVPPTGSAVAQYATFCGAFAARYGPRGSFWAANPSVPYLPVVKYEVWNEPYKFGAWKNNDGTQRLADVAAYAAMVVAAADAIHATPGCEVFAAVDTGTTNTSDGSIQPFLIPLLQTAGVLSRLDGLSVHPYGNNFYPATYNPVNTPRAAHDVEWKKSYLHTSRLQDVRATLVALGAPNLPIWATEIGYPTHLTGTSIVLGSTQAVAEAQQAQRIRAVFEMARHNDRLIQGLIFYTWQTPSSVPDNPASPNYSASNPECFFGFIHNDDPAGYAYGANATAKPAWAALQAEAAVGLTNG